MPILAAYYFDKATIQSVYLFGLAKISSLSHDLLYTPKPNRQCVSRVFTAQNSLLGGYHPLKSMVFHHNILIPRENGR